MTPDPCKLLVVDDNLQNRDLLLRRLTGSGYQVEVADGGAEALEKINQAHFDLVLLDQVMPGMSGLDLLRLLRATHSPSELPVIMVSALNDSEAIAWPKSVRSARLYRTDASRGGTMSMLVTS